MDNEYQRDQNLNQGQDANLGGEPIANQPPEKEGLFERAKDFFRGDSEKESHQRDEDVLQSTSTPEAESYSSGATRDTIPQRDDDILNQGSMREDVMRGTSQQGAMPQNQDILSGGVQEQRQGDVQQEPLQQEPVQSDVPQRPLQGDIAQEPFQRDVTQRDQDILTGGAPQGPAQGDVIQRDQGSVSGMNQSDRDVFERDQDMGPGTSTGSAVQRDRDQGPSQDQIQSQQFDNQPEENFSSGSNVYDDEAASFDMFSERDEEMSERGWDQDNVDVGDQYARSTDDEIIRGETYERPDVNVEDSVPGQDRPSEGLGERVKDKLKDLFHDSGDARSDR